MGLGCRVSIPHKFSQWVRGDIFSTMVASHRNLFKFYMARILLDKLARVFRLETCRLVNNGRTVIHKQIDPELIQYPHVKSDLYASAGS